MYINKGWNFSDLPAGYGSVLHSKLSLEERDKKVKVRGKPRGLSRKSLRENPAFSDKCFICGEQKQDTYQCVRHIMRFHARYIMGNLSFYFLE